MVILGGMINGFLVGYLVGEVSWKWIICLVIVNIGNLLVLSGAK